MIEEPFWVPKTERSSKEGGLHWTSGRSYVGRMRLFPHCCIRLAGAAHCDHYEVRAEGAQHLRAAAWYPIKGKWQPRL